MMTIPYGYPLLEPSLCSYLCNVGCSCPLGAYCPSLMSAHPPPPMPPIPTHHAPPSAHHPATLSIGASMYHASQKLLLSMPPTTGALYTTHSLPSTGPSSPILSNGSSPMPLCTSNSKLKHFIFTPGKWKQSYGMETVWLQEFSKLFLNFMPHMWYIMPVEDPPIPEDSLYSFFDSAKVRFCCDHCGHGWTSMKGRVAFWFDLTFSTGLLAFKMYGQICEKCNDPNRYEQPMWYPEEVCKVLSNVYLKIGQIYYGYLPSVPLEKGRRTGKPRTPHNSTLCQACKDGVCVYRK